MRDILKRTILVLAVSSTTLVAFAQEKDSKVRYLSLQEALTAAESDNFDVLQAGNDRMIADADARLSQAVYLPRVSVSNTATTTTDPLNVFGFRLKQESVSQNDFNPALLNNPDRFDHFSTRIDVYQPVLNLSGIMEHKAARSAKAASALLENRTRHAVVFQVKQAYFGLVMARSRVAVIDSSLAAARMNRTQASRFFEEGLITRAELLQADVHVLELETSRNSAAFEVENASDRLGYLLNLPSEDSIVPTDELRPVDSRLDAVKMDDWAADRSDMKALQLQVTGGQEMVRASQYRFTPSVDVFASYEWNGSSFLGSDGQNWGAGAVLKWNLFSGFQRSGGVARAKAALRRSELSYADQQAKNRLEIETARRAVEESALRLDLTTATVEQAQESLRVRTDRYGQGLERTTDLLAAEVMLANQRLAQVQSVYDLYVSLFHLEYLLEAPVLSL